MGMDTTCIYIAYNGKWTTDNKYLDHETKVLLVKVDTTFEALVKDIFLALNWKWGENETNIWFDTKVETSKGLSVTNDEELNICMHLLKNDINFRDSRFIVELSKMNYLSANSSNTQLSAAHEEQATIVQQEMGQLIMHIDKEEIIAHEKEYNIAPPEGPLEGLRKMDVICRATDAKESLLPGVFELPGEPAVVINGLPPISTSADDTVSPCPTVTDAESHCNAIFGQWLEGRKVRKLFGDQYYIGKVTEFDEQVGWYRVEYEDGDFEDLEWHELEEILLPMDITIPLKTVATKIMKKKQRSIQNAAKSGGRARNQKSTCKN